MGSPKEQRIAELDGIRGLAILLVLVFHFNAFMPDALGDLKGIGFLARCCWCGVDLFFALSGFLITGILLDASAPGSALHFYKRRALRILPLYYFAIGVFFVLAYVKGRPVPLLAESSFWFHLSNWSTAYSPMRYPQITHFWSLAIEEQFYLAWPLVVWKAPRRILPWLFVAIVLACIALRNLPAAQSLGSAYPNSLYRLTPFRIDALVMGGIGALVYRNRDTWRITRYLGLCAVAAAAAFAAVVIVTRNPTPFTQAMTRFGTAALSLSFASLVTWVACHSGAGGVQFRTLRTNFLRGFGKYSYCIYVIHIAIFTIALQRIDDLIGGNRVGAVASGIICIGLIYGISWCSWHGFEKRILAFGNKARPAHLPHSDMSSSQLSISGGPVE
uniref:Acyltransferase 3 n=1 Tax=Solibacter usitatus (strain Ellin6076) TaxID=234267 RepID=Q025S8_SOLUE